jgi:hypothetical protein
MKSCNSAFSVDTAAIQGRREAGSQDERVQAVPDRTTSMWSPGNGSRASPSSTRLRTSGMAGLRHRTGVGRSRSAAGASVRRPRRTLACGAREDQATDLLDLIPLFQNRGDRGRRRLGRPWLSPCQAGSSPAFLGRLVDTGPRQAVGLK